MTGGLFTRRQFTALAAAGAGGSVLLLGCGRPMRTWHFFSDDEAALLDALTSVIIPSDDTPGAREAGVVHFIDRQLLGPYKRYQPAYRAGLRGVQQAARIRFGRVFDALPADEQTALLAALESGEAEGEAWSETPSPVFVRLLVDHAFQGFYGPPRHGGNRDYVSYTVIGLDYPQILGRNRRSADGQ